MINKITPLFQISLLWLAISGPVIAQHPVLETYVQEGIANHPGLKQARLQLQSEQTNLAIAQRAHYPTVAVLGSYTLAAGGRAIDLPIGDLLNPVYGALNELTQSNSFPMVENVEEQFAPNNFIDLKVRATAPIIYPDIRLGRQAGQEKVGLQELEITRQERDLAYRIKSAYFSYLQATEAIGVYESARELVRENYRVSEALLRNDKINNGPLLRAQAELARIESELLSAQSQQKNAAAQLNTLLNKPLNSPVTAAQLPAPDSAWLQWASRAAEGEGRTELRQIDQAYRLNQLSRQQAENYTKPRLSAFVDAGAQGFVSTLDGNAPLVIAGVQLEWNLWNGGRNKLQAQAADINGQQLLARREETRNLLALQQSVALEDARSAYAALAAGREEIRAAENYFELIDKAYRQDVSSYIEWVDARTQFTNAQLRYNLQQYELWRRLAAVEQAFGG